LSPSRNVATGPTGAIGTEVPARSTPEEATLEFVTFTATTAAALAIEIGPLFNETHQDSRWVET
jgi:hypothetical protein